MVDQTIHTLFEQLYDTTYRETVSFVTKRCADPAQICDIVQEVYADVYTAMCDKGEAYLHKPQAFVRHVAKKKLARHYAWTSQLKSMLSVFAFDSDGEEEDEPPLPDLDTLPVEEQAETHLLVRDITRRLAEKPAEVQKIFLLYYSLDLPIRQIAQVLHLNESTVKTKLYRTVGELRELYRKDGMTHDGTGTA